VIGFMKYRRGREIDGEQWHGTSPLGMKGIAVRVVDGMILTAIDYENRKNGEPEIWFATRG